MDRDELIEKAKVAAMNWSHTTDPRPPSELLADFALAMIESQAVQFADNITANKEAYKAGQRAERERILERVRLMPYSWHTSELLDELRQTDPAESGE